MFCLFSTLRSWRVFFLFNFFLILLLCNEINIVSLRKQNKDIMFKKDLIVKDCDESIVTQYLIEWKVNFKRKNYRYKIDANEIDGVSARLSNLLILHIVR